MVEPLTDTPALKTYDKAFEQSEETPSREEPGIEQTKRPVAEYLQPIITDCKARFLSFQDFEKQCLKNLSIQKLGEGSYGDVYGARKPHHEQSDPDSVLKIVPIRPPTGRGSRKHTSVESLLSEFKISSLMDEFPGFLRMRTVFLVEGHYPSIIYQAYLDYKRDHEKCYNPDPTDPKNYPNNQVWAILEMEYAGEELEKLESPTLHEMYNIFWTVAFSLGRAEEQVKFEHRDLHLSNICYKRLHCPSAKKASTMVDAVAVSKRGSTRDVERTFFGRSGLQTTIIDFTLSRATLEDGTIVFDDLERMAFEQRTARNEEEVRQNTAYAQMAEIALEASKGRPKKLKWSHFNPATNVAWLSYLLASLLARSKEFESGKDDIVLRERLQSLSQHLDLETAKEPRSRSGASTLINNAREKGLLSKGDAEAIIQRLNNS
ncbi:MAG: hypothetical protein Q9160_006639 [Pyrenula sp. 1 TL-2023]